MRDSMKKIARLTSQFVQDKKYECNLGKRRRRSEEKNLGKRRRRSEENNLGSKEKSKGVYKLVDRISEMPNEILVSILSLLPLKEAAATSILSRRWQYVWMSTMILNFDTNFYMGRNMRRFISLTNELRDLESSGYVNWVNHVVEQHRGPNIKEFRAGFELNGQFTSSIDKWIQFAMEKGVQILELDFWLHSSVASKNFYKFPHKLLGLEKEDLYSHIPSLRSCGYNIGFKFLKVLYFQHVDVTDEVVEYFLSNCPVLERLTVIGTISLVNVRVVGPLAALKYLMIQYCVGLQSIHICDANLASFIYAGGPINLLLRNVPLLVEVSIPLPSIKLPFSQLSCCLSQLEILKLDIIRVDYDQNHVLPILANLKILELIVEADYYRALLHLTSFMNASPYLQRLVLKLDFRISTGDIGKIEKAAKCSHHYLKVVEIIGYRARASAVRHVMFLVKSGAALEKIVIDPVRRWQFPSKDYPSGRRDRGIEQAVGEVKAREHAMHFLKERVPSTIEFVCL